MNKLPNHLVTSYRILTNFCCILYYNRAAHSQKSVLAFNIAMTFLSVLRTPAGVHQMTVVHMSLKDPSTLIFNIFPII